jgi:hypothetical protein
MQLQVNQPDLSQMFGQDSLYNTLYGMQRQDQALANQNQNLGQAQQEQQFQAQDQPYNLQQLGANVGHTQALTGQINAQTPGIQADSNMKQRTDQVDSMIPLDKKRDATLSKIAATMTEDEAKAHEAKATSDLFAVNPDGSPNLVARKNATMVLDTMPQVRAKMREIAAQGANEAGVANINAKSRKEIEQMQEEAGKYNKYNMEFLKFQANSKANFQQQAGIAMSEAKQWQNMADQAQDPEEKQFYLSKVEASKKDYDTAVYNDYRAKQAAGTAANAAKPDLAPMGMPTVVNQGNLPTPPQAPTQQPLSQANTGVKVPPKAGDVTVHGGVKYQFLGGDPSNKANWRQM